MGALATAWQGRVSAQAAIALTNLDVETATTVNTTVLGNAETDASNDFLFRTGLAFDATKTEHLTVGVVGVTYYLHEYRGLPRSAMAQAAFEAWERACGAFARTRGALAWASPRTDSGLDPTGDGDDGATKPYFDRAGTMGDLVPPLASGDDALDENAHL